MRFLVVLFLVALATTACSSAPSYTFDQKSVDLGRQQVPFAVTGDFNSDGIADVVLVYDKDPTKSETTNHIYTLLGTTQGGFQTVGPTVPYDYTSSAAGPLKVLGAFTGDFDHDGKLDLGVVYETKTTSTVVGAFVYLGQGDGTFPGDSPTKIKTGFVIPNAISHELQVRVADVNQDQYLDLVVLVSVQTGSATTPMARLLGIQLGRADGTFSDIALVAQYSSDEADYNYNMLSVLDLHRDGKAQIVLTPGFAADGPLPPQVWAWKEGSGKMERQPDLAVGAVVGEAQFVSLDSSSQARTLVFVARDKNNALASPQLRLFAESGDLAFPPLSLPTPIEASQAFVGWADFDSDGTWDMLTADYGKQQLHIRKGMSDLAFQDTNPIEAAQSTPPVLLVGDFNGDHRPDIVFAAPASIQLLLNTTATP